MPNMGNIPKLRRGPAKESRSEQHIIIMELPCFNENMQIMTKCSFK